MFTSAKVFWVTFGIYLLVVFVPGLLIGSTIFPDAAVHKTMLACLIFLCGLYLGSLVFPFSSLPSASEASPSFRSGLALMVACTLAIVVYIALAGPPSPFLAAFAIHDSRAVAQLREEAVKLNTDALFVRVYAWGRDIFAPVTFALSIRALRMGSGSRTRLLGFVGILGALYLGLWSGQKATVLNYLVAAVIFTSPGIRSMILTALTAAPILLGALAGLFWITAPNLFGDPNALRILVQVIATRVLAAPLDVATAYIDALEQLRIIGRLDVIPYVSFLHTPGIVSAENRVALEYFYTGLDSAHANTLAFGYAYVLGGYFACFLAGATVMAGMRLSMRIVAATGSRFLGMAWSAWLCYLLLDLVQGNFVSYLTKVIVVAILVWGVHAIRPRTLTVSTSQRFLSGSTA